jgi:hypothetical protein
VSDVATLVPKNEPRCCMICGTELGPNAAKCIKCGSFQTDVRCTFCHLGLPTGATVCPSCKTLQESEPCKSCGAAIACGCRRCSECGSWQNWRRYFQGLEVSFALILSFFSVLSAVTPLFARYWSNHSETYVRLLGSAPFGQEEPESTILVLAANNGKRMSFIDSATLEFIGLPAAPNVALRVRNIDQQAVPADQTAKIYLTGSVKTSNRQAFMDAIDRGEGKVRLTVIVHETDRNGAAIKKPRVDTRDAVLLKQWIDDHAS